MCRLIPSPPIKADFLKSAPKMILFLSDQVLRRRFEQATNCHAYPHRPGTWYKEKRKKYEMVENGKNSFTRIGFR